MSLLEKEIENRVVAWGQRNGFLTPKVKFVEAGWPDRLFISPLGHTIFMEFKQPGQKPDMLQEHRLEQLRRRGIPATWTDNAVEGINILKAAVEPARVPETSDNVTPFPGERRPVAGSGTGENVNLSSRPEDLISAGVYQESVDSGPVETDVHSLACGNPEVDGFQPVDVPDPPLESEGSNACE